MKDQGLATRDRILDIAQAMIQEQGYHAVSFRHLAVAVDIKAASIHYYFPSKEDLVEALVQRYREFFAVGRAGLDGMHLSPTVRLEKYIGLVVASFKKTGRMCLCGVLAAEASALPERISASVRAFFEENEAWLCQVLTAGRKAGEMQLSGKPEETARAVFAALEGALMSAWTFHDHARIEFVGQWLRKSLHPRT